MPEDNPLDQTKDAVDDHGAAVYADRLKKHVVKHMAAGHPAHIAVALAQQSMAQEDEANEVGESEPDADDKAMTVVQPLGQVVDGQPLDIPAVARSVGATDDIGAIKRALIAIARRSGLLDQLPHEWFDESLEIAPGGLRKSFDEQLRAGLKTLGLLKDEPDTATAFKVAGNHWVASWSNNLEDRDGEIFTAKAIDDFVARVDMGAVPRPELWVWHVPGSRIGQAEWVDRHGHFLMAMGTFDDTDAGRKARDFYSKHAGSKSLSHGFTFPVSQFDGKHYHQFNTFEISLLPRGAEANLYTSLEGVKEMAKVISEAKKAELFAAFGEVVGARILAAEDAKGKALDDLGINSKDFVQPTADNGAANKEAVDAANKAFTDLVPDLMEGSAEAVIAANEAVKTVKAQNAVIATLQADNADLHAALKEIRDELALKPRAASSDTATALDTSTPAGKALLDKVNKQLVERDEFWMTEVVKS